MQSTTIKDLRQAHAAGELSSEQVGGLIDAVDELSRQVAWFKRQLFGEKSERRHIESDPQQGSLDPTFDALPERRPEGKKSAVAAHERARKPHDPTAEREDATPFFDEAKVPVETIEVPCPEAEGLAPDQFEVIGQKISHRLAQRPAAYVVLRYVRPIIKLRETLQICCAPAPAGVLDGSRADVSFIAGTIIDKLAYHLPLYRQHQRLQAAGFRVSRQWLTQLVQQAVALLEPIHEAMLQGVLDSRVLAMDETPIKAGLAKPGKMRQAYFWPVYGEHDEICFLYYPDRSAQNVRDALGLKPPEGRVLLTDGYAAYETYAAQVQIKHAQCWVHSRRHLFEARQIEPDLADHGLELIGQMYGIEAEIRQRGLDGPDKLAQRQQRSRPLVTAFFDWVDGVFERHGLLPSNPLMKALAYIRERKAGLQVFLADPDVPMDTNHLENAIRRIPLGKRNWLFCWTELGARQVGMMQSLLTTCCLHDVDPYDYLVDVLQRVGEHPASRVSELTPRNWKERFAGNPLRSALAGLPRPKPVAATT